MNIMDDRWVTHSPSKHGTRNECIKEALSVKRTLVDETQSRQEGTVAVSEEVNLSINNQKLHIVTSLVDNHSLLFREELINVAFY